jgi:hypothetical protein
MALMASPSMAECIPTSAAQAQPKPKNGAFIYRATYMPQEGGVFLYQSRRRGELLAHYIE